MLTNEWFYMPLLFGLGCLAGFLNVMAGGGSIITMPMLIFLGLDGATANGTNRIAVFAQNLFAVASFHGEKKYDLKSALNFSAWTLPGAVAGALLAVSIEDALFKKILAFVIIGVMITVLVPTKKSADGGSPKHAWLIYPALLGIGFYGGFIQAGVGFFLMAAFMHILRQNLVQVNMNKVFIVFINTMPALAIFMLSGNVHYVYAVTLAAGNSLGAWWSAKLAIKKGDKIIRLVLFAVVIVMSVKLLDLI